MASSGSAWARRATPAAARPAGAVGAAGPIDATADPTGLSTAVRENDQHQLIPLPPPPAPVLRFTPGALYRRFDVGGQKLVTLTFDDGPWPRNTRAVMATLRANGLEGVATFFWVGVNVQRYPDIAREVVRRGYTIGNHGMTHSYNLSTMTAEVDVAQRTIVDAVGVRPLLFRSPGLTTGPVLQDKLRRLGMCNVFTDTDLRDWVAPRISAAQIVANVGQHVHSGWPLLLHEGGDHQPTIDAVQGVIDTIRRRGYRIVSMAQMMQAASGR